MKSIKKTGFSVTELVVVLLLIGILGTILVPRIKDMRKSSAQTKNAQAIQAVVGAIERARAAGVTITNLNSPPPGDYDVTPLIQELLSLNLFSLSRPLTSNQISAIVVDQQVIFTPTFIP